MNVSSLYTNIDHEKGTEACFKKLEERKHKSILSIFIKNLILTIFKSKALRFGNEYYWQITGTAMGTPMATNYANLFLDNFEQNLMHYYSQKLDYHVRYGFVLLTIFSLYGPVTRTHWIISFPSHRITSHRITVNPRT